MRSHSIETVGGEFHDEPTVIPDGEMPCLGCSHTDCLDCGREIGRTMIAAAAQDTRSLITLALEVCYQVERYGKDIPGHAFTLGTLARFSGMPRPLDKAWAEGVTEALTDTAHVQAKYPTVDESEAYMRGVALVAWWREDQKRKRDVASAKANVNAWTAMSLPSPVTPSEFTPCTLRAKVERLGIAYAAGATVSAGPSPRAMTDIHRGESGPGFESRSQHRAEGGNASRGLHSPLTASRRGG
jgi:hypothetical protein